MVHVTVNLCDQEITGISIKGHANSVRDDAQYDLVCAEVSAVSVGVLNAIDEICGEECCDIVMGSGNVEIMVKKSTSDLQIILRTLKIQLETIEYSNGQFIKIKARQSKK